jgi:hypothetical protein
LGQACLIYAEETFLHIEIPAIDPWTIFGGK